MTVHDELVLFLVVSQQMVAELYVTGNRSVHLICCCLEFVMSGQECHDQSCEFCERSGAPCALVWTDNDALCVSYD